MRLFILLVAMALSQVAVAQIRGTVFDQSGTAVPFANVVLLNVPDSAYVTGCVTSDDGKFKLTEKLSKDKPYVLKVTFVGYNTLYKNVTNPADVGILTLAENASMMKNVEVAVTRPKTRITADAMVTDVEGTVLEKTGDVYDMLKHVTGVTVKNEDVTVIGAGTPQIYVNGRLVRDKDELHNLMADQVKKVEVVNSPGARYEASVPAVIRITKKKEAGDGVRMDLKGEGSYMDGADGWSANTSDMFGFRKKRFDLSFRYSHNSWKADEDIFRLQDLFGNNYLSEESTNYATSKSHSHTFTTDLNYDLDDNNSVGIRYDVSFNPNNSNSHQMHSTLSENQHLQEESQTFSNSFVDKSSHYINLYYTGKKKGWNIDFNADAYHNKMSDSQLANTSWQTVANEEGTEDISSTNRSDNSLFAGKIIIEHSLWGGTMSLGSEVSYTNHFDEYKEDGDKIKPAETRLKEDDEAVFVEYKHAFGPLIALAGTRYEHVGSNYYVFGEYQKDQSRQYHNVFPRLNLSLPIKNFNFSLSYRNSIERPDYDFLSYSMEYLNKYMYSQGNPYLKPAITHSVTFNAAYKWITLTTGFQNIRDKTALILSEYEPAPTIMLMQWQNINPYNTVHFEIEFNPTIKFWMPNISFHVSKQWYTQEFCGEEIHLNKPQIYVCFYNTFAFKHNWHIEANYDFTSKRSRSAYQFTTCIHSLGFGIRKGFLDDKLQLTLSAEDLLGSKYADIIYGSISKQSSKMLSHYRNISFTIRYKFNSAQSKYKGTGAGEEQKNRM